jgi:hypothetical protein
MDGKSKLIILKEINPTIFLKNSRNGLQQLIRLKLENNGPLTDASVMADIQGEISEFPLPNLPHGESVHEVFINEITHPQEVEFILKVDTGVIARKTIPWLPPKHWTVHIVQLSHHDVGYTGLPSNVLKKHDRYLDRAINMAEVTEGFPFEAQFRIVIEQAWSMDHYLKHADKKRRSRIVELMRSGRIELTALFGNMITEICGHESLIRTLYPAFRIKHKYGIPVVSAEHNDITGISWGLCRVLTDAGIKIFCPGIPLYYSWGNKKFQSFWDEKSIFPQGGPGAFWWEAPSGKRILFWCNNSGCGGSSHPNLPGLTDKLEELTEQGYSYDILRWPVQGGVRDNSPYIEGFAHTIKDWNQRWAYPKLISSTNAIFYESFVKEIPQNLPVFRGELAGQDYPVGATSTAYSTAVNRNNHSALLSAEKFATIASFISDYSYQGYEINKAYEDTLLYDEHTWGHHFLAGPAMDASVMEKTVHAHRAAALCHDVSSKAMAKIADNIKKNGDDFYLVVFNSLSRVRTGVVHVPLREIENCEMVMTEVSKKDDPGGKGFLQGTSLQGRNHIALTEELIAGKFDLIAETTGEKIPYQTNEITSPYEPIPYASQRYGLGSGDKQHFNKPFGFRCELCFIAKDVPACGYKTFRLLPQKSPKIFKTDLRISDNFIENKYYLIKIDPAKKKLVSIYDKEAGVEIIDKNAPHHFGEMIVRTPYSGDEKILEVSNISRGFAGPVCASVDITGMVHGHPAVRQSIRLYSGFKRIEFSTRILKDATPLLDVHLAFPFAIPEPEFRYEGTLSAMNPIDDYLPGSYSDTIGIQNWVKVNNKDCSIFWSSLDAPIAGFGGLWPGYVSPAHSGIIGKRTPHPPLKKSDLKHGWIYSNIFCNNFATNFSVSQVCDVLFRYVITTCKGNISDIRSAVFGRDAITPFAHIFTKHPDEGSLPADNSFIRTEGDEIIFLNCKRAEDRRGIILRFWNISPKRTETKILLGFMNIGRVNVTSPIEEDTEESLAHDKHSFMLTIEPRALATIRTTIRMTRQYE